MSLTLTEEQAEKLTASLEEANRGLKESREQMADLNTKVGELLKEREKLQATSTSNENAIKKVQSDLDNLAAKMESLAQSHTTALDQQRKLLKSIDQGVEVGKVWKAPDGAIWESRQQALEVGMFFMATMKRDCEARRGARRWLQEHKSGLRYLPNIPKSFVEEFGAQWFQQVQEYERSGDVQTLTGGTTPGSVLVRPEFAQTLIANIEQYGVFRQEALRWPMGSDTVYIPRRKSGFATVYWEGEGEAGSAQDPAFDLLGMPAKKILMLHQYSSELSMDAAISIASIIMTEFALAFAQEEDRIGFNGTGAGGNSPGYAGFIGVLGMTRNGDTPPIGPIAVTGAAAADTTAEVTEAKLRAMTGHLHTWARANAKWYLHRTVLADLCGISMGTAGGSVVSFHDGAPASIMRYPVREVEAMPASTDISASTPAFALGDLRKGWILGDRQQPEIETSEHYAFNSDLLTVRAKQRIGFLPVQPNAMVVYVTGTQS